MTWFFAEEDGDSVVVVGVMVEAKKGGAVDESAGASAQRRDVDVLDINGNVEEDNGTFVWVDGWVVKAATPCRVVVVVVAVVKRETTRTDDNVRVDASDENRRLVADILLVFRLTAGALATPFNP